MRAFSRGLAVAVALLLMQTLGFAKKYGPEYEARVGAEAAAQIEKEEKLWTGEEADATTAQLQAIIDEIKLHTSRPDVQYTVKLLDNDEVNAFAIPGGYVYVCKGLMDEIQSKHELAAVLAHEMAHNCTYDALKQLDRAQKMTLTTAAAVLAAVVIGGNDEMPWAVWQAGSLITRGVLSHYSIQIEKQADLHALQSLLPTDYNPVGLLTFMERLAAKERAAVPFDAGIFESHPPSVQRCIYLTQALQDAGVFINRRAVTKWDPPVVETVPLGDDPEAGSVQVLKLWDVELFRFDQAPEGMDVADRGAGMVERLTQALADGAAEYEFRVQQTGENYCVTGIGETILTVYDFDAALAGKSAQETAQAVVTAIRTALRKDFLANLYD